MQFSGLNINARKIPSICLTIPRFLGTSQLFADISITTLNNSDTIPSPSIWTYNGACFSSLSKSLSSSVSSI
ncbi:hypothetical protein OMAG_002664 [Candidatus Omnitrophus magneticus]|uniref:Uncharacterized protein n=1 Tax=Candidatus Omnitrophus magneticus TaxID=1609969 RepID=A0A0F0CJH5_9BACT|nr:hypothetical protein OMAG_002664 [Candidatus Omnitrophus magneticus]